MGMEAGDVVVVRLGNGSVDCYIDLIDNYFENFVLHFGNFDVVHN